MSQSKSTSKPRAPSLKLLADVLNSINEGVVVAQRGFERNGLLIRHVNEAMGQISGYSAAELIGQFHGRLHRDRDSLEVMRQWHRDLPKVRPLEGECYLKRKDGSALYTAWTLTALTDSRNRLTHIVVTYRDMTANRQLQEALVHSQRLDAVGRLAGGVAHDFNNLLSVINGYCEILNHNSDSNIKGRDEIHAIHQAGQRAVGLVRQLLAFSRRQSLEPRIIAPNRLILENVDILSRIFGHDRSLELDLSDEVKNIRVDPAQLQQVLLNLCINARDATEPNGRIVISSENRRINPPFSRRITDLKAGDYVILRVSDNGCGMDAATQSVLFEPFFTTKGEGLGTGLGLALVHGIVNQSGGHIFVHSSPGEGATFEIYFPARTETAVDISGTLVPFPQTSGRESLLIVEDDDVVRKMIAGILTADGYDVAAFSSAASALRKWKQSGKSPDLVIADYTENQGEVRRMLEKLQHNSPALRVLCIPSGSARPLAGLAKNRQHILLKPFALSTLIQDVRRLLDNE